MTYHSALNIKKVYKTATRAFYTGLIHMALDNRDSLSKEEFSSIIILASRMLVSSTASIDGAKPKMLRDMAMLDDGAFYADVEQADVHNKREFGAAVYKMLEIMVSMKDEPIYSPSSPEADECRKS